ncbi:MAG: Peptidase 2 protein [Bacteroidetes bacterium]|nr:Peptidase 2 protein [Bacteroidota bacterium]
MFTLVGPHTPGEYFSQSGTWGGVKYDTYRRPTYDKKADSVDADGNPVYWKIYQKGCALSCVAMALKAFGCDVDPGKLNAWMTDHHGFNGSSIDWKSTVLGWSSSISVSDQVGKGLYYEGDVLKRPLDSEIPGTEKLDQNLLLGYPAFVQFVNPDTGHEHWALVTGKTQRGQYTVLDPGNDRRVVLDNSSTKFYKYRLVTPQ